MNIQKGIFASVVAILFVAAVPSFVQAYSSTYGGSYDSTYTPSSSNSSSSGDYSGGCCTSGYSSTYDGSYDSTYTPSYSSTYTSSYDSTYTPSYSSTYTPSYDSTYTPSYDSTYTPSYDSTYTPSYNSTYTPSYNSTFTPTYTTTYTPTYVTPPYTTPSCTGSCGGSTYTPPSPTCSLSVTPNKISDGGSASVTLSWSSSNTGNGGGLTLWNDNDHIMYGTTPHNDISLSGSKTVTITGAHTFHVDVWNSASKTGRCSAAVTVTATPAPTCTISVDKTNVNVGGPVNVSWSSTNAPRGDIVNLGTNLPASGSHATQIGNTTTFTGTFYGSNGKTATCSKTVTVTQPQCPSGYTGSYPNCQAPQCPSGYTGTYPNCVAPQCPSGYTGSYPNCQPPQYCPSGYTGTYPNCVPPQCPAGYSGTYPNCQPPQYCPSGYSGTYPNCVPPPQYCPAGYSGTYPNCVPPTPVTPWCSITINNNSNSGYFNANQPVTLSWNSSNASYGSINQGWGSVNLTGSRTIYPTQTTTYTGTFTNSNGQTANCSVTVYINNYVPPQNPNTPFITLAAVPYTGLELGPVGTALYWAFLAFWCALAAYLIVVKKVQNQVYNSLMTVLFGSSASHAAVAHAAPAAAGHSHATHAVHVEARADATDPFIVSQINRAR